MIQGTITVRHILAHPIMLISLFGVMGYVKLLMRCCDSTPDSFTAFLFK